MLIVIPARGDSKGLPRKNLAMCGGRTLLDHVLVVAEAIPDATIVVTTNDDEIAEYALSRASARLAYPPLCHGDESRAIDVWRDAWTYAEDIHARRFNVSCYLEPTSPLRTVEHVKTAIDMLINPGVERPPVLSVVSMERVPLKYHSARQFDDEASSVEELFRDKNLRRQELMHEPRFVKNGAVYCAKREIVMEWSGKIFSDFGYTRILETEPLVNIDTAEDLAEAERRLNEGETT